MLIKRKDLLRRKILIYTVAQECLHPFLKLLKLSCWGYLCLNFSPIFPQLKPSGWALFCARGEHLGENGWAQPPFNWDSVWLQVLSDLIPQPQSGEMVSSADSWLCQITVTQKTRGDTHADVARSHMEKETPVGRKSNCCLLTSII